MFSISKTMTLGLVSGLSVVITFGTGFGWLLQRLSRNSKGLDLGLIAHSHDILSNIKTVKLFVTEEYESTRMSKLQNDCYEANKSFSLFAGIFDGLSELLTATVVGSVLLVGCNLITKDSINFGNLFSFLNSANSAQKSLSQIGPLQNATRKMKETLAVVAEYVGSNRFDTEQPLFEHDLKGSIECRNLTFAYPCRPNAVSNLSLRIKPGSMVGICGPSGSGKSTLAALLTRLYDPPKGHLYIDGIDVNEIEPRYLRKQVGLIDQEAALFEGTIADNIRYGSPEATDEEMLAAAKLANVNEFVHKLPNGFETEIGNRGYALSGGQKQRIAIARTMLKNPKILILDEATSALDSKKN
jgi:ATP-binding cassette subfamily B (MDR/TAP) protein 8